MFPGKNSEFGNQGGCAGMESLWVSWKNRILGNGDAGAFDPFEARVPKSPPDPIASYALRTRCARADHRHIEILGVGVADLVGDCISLRIGKLDRVGRAVATYPPDPSDWHAAYSGTRWINPDRHGAATYPTAPELA
jgi:hypothetical protein